MLNLNLPLVSVHQPMLIGSPRYWFKLLTCTQHIVYGSAQNSKGDWLHRCQWRDGNITTLQLVKPSNISCYLLQFVPASWEQFKADIRNQLRKAPYYDRVEGIAHPTECLIVDDRFPNLCSWVQTLIFDQLYGLGFTKSIIGHFNCITPMGVTAQDRLFHLIDSTLLIEEWAYLSGLGGLKYMTPSCRLVFMPEYPQDEPYSNVLEVLAYEQDPVAYLLTRGTWREFTK